MSTADQIRIGRSAPGVFPAPWEVGGFFEATEISDRATVRRAAGSVFVALARHVVLGILRVNESIRRLWIPDYFCPHVSRHWSRLIRTLTYRDDPSLPEPDLKSLRPAEHDLVVAVNYLGTRDDGID